MAWKRHGLLAGEAMRWIYSDAGRAKSKRPRQSRDCTVRSLAVCLQLTYDAAYDMLANAGRKGHHAFDLEACARKTLFRDGFGDTIFFKLQKMGFQKGNRCGHPATRRYRLEDFCEDNPKDRFIVGTAGHVMAVVDGDAYDDLPYHFNENRPVYSWLEPIPNLGLPMWQAYALRSPIRKGGTRMVKRAVAIVEGATYKQALRNASQAYEWSLRSGEDLHVEALDAP